MNGNAKTTPQAEMRPTEGAPQRRALPKAVEAIQREEGDDGQPRLRLDKASGAGLRIVAWLLKCDDRTKLAVVLASALLQHEPELREPGFYAGEIGNDLLADWEQAVCNRHLEAETGDDDVWIVGFTSALLNT